MFEEKEMFKVVEQTIGKTPAKITLTVMIAGAVSGALVAIGTLAYLSSTYVVRPLLTLVPALPQGTVATAAIAFVASGVMIASVTYWLLRRWRRWDADMTEVLDKFLRARFQLMEQRLTHLEQNSASKHSVNSVIAGLDSRLQIIEPPPLDMSSTYDAAKLSLASLQRAAASRPPRFSPTVDATGTTEPEA